MTKRGGGLLAGSVLMASLLVASSVAGGSGSDAARGPGMKKVISASTGLVGFGEGKLVRLSLVDVAERSRPRSAVLRILDDRNEVLAEAKGRVAPGMPLILELRRDDVPGADRLQIRGTAKMRRQRQAGNVLNFTMEVGDPDEGDCECQAHCPQLCDECFPPPGQRGQFMKGDCSITFSDTLAAP